MNDQDTITAIATPPGTGGIGIIRISGIDAKEILHTIFRLKSGKLVNDFEDHKLYYGFAAKRNGVIIDECMAVLMKKPRSYTTEDVAEIHCHGGMIILRTIMDEIIFNGARLAQPGEFTKRAFLNGRIDLTQAEAVMDIITSSTEHAAELSVIQLEGKLGKIINSLKERLLDVAAAIEAAIDYPDDLGEIGFDSYSPEIEKALAEINDLVATYDYGRILSQGLKVVIAGKPNVGKSSLLNALAKYNRAIVTPIPGTTRDTIEETLNIKGIPVKITDTAGIRETEDFVEKIGIDRAKKSIDEADLVLLVIDSSSTIDEEDIALIKAVKGKKTIFVFNKIDLSTAGDTLADLGIVPDPTLVKTSITQDIGINEIEDIISEMVFKEKVKSREDVAIVSARHREALINAGNSLRDCVAAAGEGMPVDLISIDIRAAWQYLASITGESLSEDLIDRIFSKFCLGK